MTLALLDPWLIEAEVNGVAGAPVEAYDRLEALRAFDRLCTTRDLVPVRFLPETFWNVVDFSKGRISAPIARICNRLIRQGGGSTEARLVGAPVPALSKDWYRALHDAIDLAAVERWRDPVLFVPQSRRRTWPDGHEIEVELRSADRCLRVLATIESAESHPHFDPDLDPWRLGSAGGAVEVRATREQREARRRLPRPHHLTGRPIAEWVETLASIRSWASDDDTRRYFLPEAGWDPRTIAKEDWRTHRVFPRRTKQTAKGPKAGPIDRDGRIWAWDPEENHWDVQSADVRDHAGYDRVGDDGRLLG